MARIPRLRCCAIRRRRRSRPAGCHRRPIHTPDAEGASAAMPSNVPPSESAPAGRPPAGAGREDVRRCSNPASRSAGSRRAMKRLVSGACIRQNSRLTPAHDGVRFGRRGGMHTNQSHQARGPHARRQPFPADVAQRQNQPAARLLDGKEVTRQIADGKDLTGNLEVTAPHQARGAEASDALAQPRRVRCGDRRNPSRASRTSTSARAGAPGGMRCGVAERSEYRPGAPNESP